MLKKVCVLLVIVLFRKNVILAFCFFIPFNLLAGESINLGVSVSGTTTEATCTISAVSDRFALTVTGLPVGSTSYAGVAWKSGVATCSAKTSGITCSEIMLPHYTVSCNGTKTGTISFSGSSSVTDTTSAKTLTINSIIAAYGTGTSLTSGQSMSVSNGSDLDIYLGARFNFPSDLDYSTSYTWSGSISNAITIDF